jgi:cellulose synthase/poly-beta-1,6-N-acetylglucosamine synthase-like glycosyltransferase
MATNAAGRARPPEASRRLSPGRSAQLRVSVVVPVRDAGALIARCLDSLVAQDYPRELMELIVVDNGSGDDTRGVIAGYDVTLLVETDLRTSYAARNRGIRHATGEIVAFLDADCVAAPDWLAELVRPFADACVGAVAGAVDDATASSICQEFTGRLQPFARPLRKGLATLLTANVAIRRDALEAVGLFDECLPTAGDVDLGWRLQQQLGLTIAENRCARVQHVHRSTFGGVFRQYLRYGASEILLTTLYRGGAGSVAPRDQRRRLLAQLRAMASYVRSFGFRLIVSMLRRGVDRRYALWPLFLLTAEGGNVAGKLLAMLRTRYYRRNPYSNRRPIARTGTA